MVRMPTLNQYSLLGISISCLVLDFRYLFAMLTLSGEIIWNVGQCVLAK